MTESLIGTKVGHYRIVDRIAAGGMGEVYVGYDETLQRRVALKRIRPEFHLSELAKARFQREARVLSQLGHPNICQIHDYLEGGESDFIVMELVEGRSLTQAMKAGLDARTKARIAEQVVGVLVAAHGKGVVHRDLKPDNVMLAAGGQVKVLDFGLSREVGDKAPAVGSEPPAPEPSGVPADELEEAATRSSANAPSAGAGAGSQENLTTVGTIMGTVGYMSPEQARGEAATAASDLYAFGLMLQELFTGNRPYERGLKGAALMEKAKKGETLPATGIDRDLAALIARLKSVEPAARPSAIDVAEKLEWIRRKPQKRRRRMAVAAGFAAVILAAIAIGISRHQAVVGRHQAEAAQLLSLGRLRLNDHPNAALAYAIASVERSDNDPARRFAVEALAQGPPALFSSGQVQDQSYVVKWSPDGERLAVSGDRGVEILSRETGERRQFGSTTEWVLGFTPDGRGVVTTPSRPPHHSAVKVWALPEGRLERTLQVAKGWSIPFFLDDHVLAFEWDPSAPGHSGSALVHLLSLDGAADRVLGRWPASGPKGIDWDFDSAGRWIVYWQNGRVYQRRLDDLSSPPRELGAHEAGWATVTVRPWRDRAVTSDDRGNVLIWDLPSARLERALKSPTRTELVALDPKGRFLASWQTTAGAARSLVLFDLAGPPTAEPSTLIADEGRIFTMEISPDGSWLAGKQGDLVILWNLGGARPALLGRNQPPDVAVAFTPDGHLLSSDKGGLRLWSLAPGAGKDVRVLPSSGAGGPPQVDPQGRFAVVTLQGPPRLRVVPLDGSPAKTYTLNNPPGADETYAWRPSLDPSGRYVAMTFFSPDHSEVRSMRVLDLATGAERILDTHIQGVKGRSLFVEAAAIPLWMPDGRLVSEGAAGLRVWDLAAGTSLPLRPPFDSSEGADELLQQATPDSRSIVDLATVGKKTGRSSLLLMTDLATGTTREIASHGNRLTALALDSSGTILVTGDLSGVIRVGRLTGEEPHLLYGHTEGVTSVAVSPDGKWIASGGDDGTIRLWPMPDLSKPPLHTLPHDELLAKLKALTNLRAVRDPASDTGWKIEIGPFPGWAHVPEWQP